MGNKLSLTPKTGVLLINLGTPDSTDTSDVRKYLREFLMDKRVIDIPFIPRWLLVNLIITTFRAPKSAAEYRKLFTPRGSPLKFHTEDVVTLLKQKIDEQYVIEYGMRYQNPSIKEGLEKLQRKNVAKIHVIPLFPQYASATSGSVIDKVMEIVKSWQTIPEIRFTSQFFDDKLFIETIVHQGRKMMLTQNYDHFIFSYHGLPERQIIKGSKEGQCRLGTCCNKLVDKNRFCYRAQCFETTRLIAQDLDLMDKDYTVCFQSRLGKDPWIQPYTEEVLKDLALSGTKKVLAFSPAFVSDCLETTIEVGEAYQEEFIELGGDVWDLVPSLNTEDKWIKCLSQIITKTV